MWEGISFADKREYIILGWAFCFCAAYLVEESVNSI